MKQRLEAGERRLDAAHAATSEYLPIVVTAGLIVAGGTAALVAGELEFFRAFGPGMALTVLVSLAISVTLIPALMAILGSRLYWPRTLAVDKRPSRPSRVAYLVTARPVAVIALVAVVGLAVACRGLLDTKLGITRIRGLPKRRSSDKAPRGGGAGLRTRDPLPHVLLLEGVDPEQELSALVRFQRRLEREPGIAAAIGPATAVGREIPGLVVVSDPPAARILLVLDREPQGGPATDIVEQLRDRLPELTKQAGLDTPVRIAGDTALAEETVRTITHDLIRIGIAAFLVNFLLSRSSCAR